MMRCTVTYGELERAFLSMGFVAEDTTGEHKVFRHQPTDTLVLLPPGPAQTPLEAIRLLPTRKIVGERGVVEGDAFDRLLGVARGVETMAASD